jgi:opacity protein-like surface antigen
MRIKCVTLLAALGLLVVTAPAAAQVFCIPVDESAGEPDLDDVAACAAATTTPFGALPTNLPANWLGRTSTGIGFHFGFGSMDEEGDAGRRNFGIGIDLPVGRASLGFTGGLVDFTCDVPGVDLECENAFMLGARFATPLISTAVSSGGTGQSFIVGLNTSVGFSNGDILSLTDAGETVEIGSRGITVGVGVPLGLVARSGTITITPFIEPAFFWGQTKFDFTSTFEGSEEDTESGTGFALGGGVSFGFASGLALDIGFKKVMIDEANALIGVGLSFQR